MEASIITTYRCNSKCKVCAIWEHPSHLNDEFAPRILEKLPKLTSCNVTGGEPFLREDVEDIVKIIKKKARRVVISTNGYFTDRIVQIAERNKDIGIRISIEGLPTINDYLRGIKDDFDHAMRTLIRLCKMGLKDIGIAITVSDANYTDLVDLFQLSRSMHMEFATAVVHNSYYFHKYGNKIEEKEEIMSAFRGLICQLFSSYNVKNWYRAYFNYGLINYVKGKERLLPCTAGTDMFFLDPYGEVLPCNGMEESCWFGSMGNLKEKTFAEIWNSPQADSIRDKVKNCPKNCWMIGTASPIIKKHFAKATVWIFKHKFLGLPIE